MNLSREQLPAIGAAFEGGFYGGIVSIDGAPHAIVWAPKAEGETRAVMLSEDAEQLVATSYSNSLANTRALAELGSPAALWALSLRIGGHADWSIPARDVLELGYRHFKPGTRENYCGFRDGDNPSSLPAGYPYIEESPIQTAAEAFRTGGTEAFEERWYWASTQASSGGAWYQYFLYGLQGYDYVSADGAVRAVRSIPLSA